MWRERHGLPDCPGGRGVVSGVGAVREPPDGGVVTLVIVSGCVHRAHGRRAVLERPLQGWCDVVGCRIVAALPYPHPQRARGSVPLQKKTNAVGLGMASQRGWAVLRGWGLGSGVGARCSVPEDARCGWQWYCVMSLMGLVSGTGGVSPTQTERARGSVPLRGNFGSAPATELMTQPPHPRRARGSVPLRKQLIAAGTRGDAPASTLHSCTRPSWRRGRDECTRRGFRWSSGARAGATRIGAASVSWRRLRRGRIRRGPRQY